MIEIDVEDGWLLVTAINRTNGEVTTGTYALKSVGESTGGHQRIVAIGMNTEDQDESFTLSVRPASADAPEVEPYQELIRQMIKTDEPCPGYACKVTMLGHLLAGCSPEQVAMVKALDPDHAEGA
jgi:hypothetical protein